MLISASKSVRLAILCLGNWHAQWQQQQQPSLSDHRCTMKSGAEEVVAVITGALITRLLN